MTHNKKIKTFADITCHIKLKDEHLEAIEPSVYAYVVESSSKRFFSFSRKWYKSKKGMEVVQIPKNKNKQYCQKKGKVKETIVRWHATIVATSVILPVNARSQKRLFHFTLSNETFIFSIL